MASDATLTADVRPILRNPPAARCAGRATCASPESRRVRSAERIPILAFLQRGGVKAFDDPNYERYSKGLARLRAIRKYVCRMDALGRGLSYYR